MYILTPDNESFDTNKIAYDQNIDLNYCVLDYSNKEDVDYKFPPLVFLEEFSKPGTEIKIGEHVMKVPWDWCVLVGDAEIGDLELIDLRKINGRPFNAFTINPISSYMPKYFPLRIMNYYNEIRWTVPVIKQEHMLCVPLTTGDNPTCVFFCEAKNKLPDVIDVKLIT